MYTNMKAIGNEYLDNGVTKQVFEVTDTDTNEVVIKTFYKEGDQWKPVQVHKIDLTKRLGNSTAAISLKKNTISLDKTLVNLSKTSGINLQDHRARVAVDLDFSGSMNYMYSNGDVQRAVTRLFPLALRFDDNGELDSWIFENGYHHVEGMTLENFENYIKKCILDKGYDYGGTNYAPVIKDNLDFYFGGSEQKSEKKGFFSKLFGAKDTVEKAPDESSNYPVFVIFITDGDNFDKRETNEIIRKASKENIFIQFVGIGDGSFNYLTQLDDLDGRECDNTGFMRVAVFDKMTDDELYSNLLDQYVKWLNVKGLR